MLDHSFYLGDTLEISKKLLGKYIVRQIDGIVLRAKIMETEAYMGNIDKASHAYPMKKTPRTEVMFGPGGVAYVYLIYGMYNCFNIVTAEAGMPHAVLIRGIEPLNEIDTFSQNRYGKNFAELTTYQRKNMNNGPGKLCNSLQIDRTLNGHDLSQSPLWIEDGEEISDEHIQVGPRINIDYAEEAIHFPWRFQIINLNNTGIYHIK